MSRLAVRKSAQHVKLITIYVQRLQKLIYLHLFTDCFMKISLKSLGPTTSEEKSS